MTKQRCIELILSFVCVCVATFLLVFTDMTYAGFAFFVAHVGLYIPTLRAWGANDPKKQLVDKPIMLLSPYETGYKHAQIGFPSTGAYASSIPEWMEEYKQGYEDGLADKTRWIQRPEESAII